MGPLVLFSAPFIIFALPGNRLGTVPQHSRASHSSGWRLARMALLVLRRPVRPFLLEVGNLEAWRPIENPHSLEASSVEWTTHLGYRLFSEYRIQDSNRGFTLAVRHSAGALHLESRPTVSQPESKSSGRHEETLSLRQSGVTRPHASILPSLSILRSRLH